MSEPQFPSYLKLDYGTASTGVWRIGSFERLKEVAVELDSKGLMDGGCELILQKAVRGPLERLQAIFENGRLVGIHGYRQLEESIGGGDIAKLGRVRAKAQEYLRALGEHLRWHGALSADYIYLEEKSLPVFIDCNPRLVEPMNATLSGVNLADMLVGVSSGNHYATLESGRSGVRTHMLVMALLSAAAQRRSRIDVLRELHNVICKHGIFAASEEELLPIHRDVIAAFPLCYVLMQLLANPRVASLLGAETIGAYSLTPDAVRQIINS